MTLRTKLGISAISTLLLLAASAQAQVPFCAQVFAENSAIQTETKTQKSELIPGTVLPPKKEMVLAAKSLIQTIENNYGPLFLKERTIGLNWQKQKQKLMGEMGKVKSESELLFRLSNFLFTLNDAHVSVQLPSTLRWTLPLQVSYALEGNKYVLNAINREALTKMNLIEGELPPLGAELLSINGKSTEQFRKDNLIFNAISNELTSRSMFGSRLFDLKEASGIPLFLMKNEGWNFEFQWTDTQGVTKKSVAKLKYNVEGIGITGLKTRLPEKTPLLPKVAVEPKVQLAPSKHPELENLIKKMNALFGAEFGSSEKNTTAIQLPGKTEGSVYKIGQTAPLFKLPKDFRRIDLPEELTKVFDETKIFAGTFVHNGKRVGILRIPTYSIENVTSAPKVIDYLVSRLEGSTDYLILDQMHNPGGAVVYSDFWIHALVGKFDTSKHLQFKVKPTAHFMNQFRELLQQFEGAMGSLPEATKAPLIAEIRQQYEIIHKAFRERAALSEPITLLPMTRFLNLALDIQAIGENGGQLDLFTGLPIPSSVLHPTYSKKIYMLTDQFDFSGGDATPASLKAYERVTLIGERTAGAGGTVEAFTSRETPYEFGYRLTTSLMYQPANPENPYVENYGIQPHIRFETKAEDYTSGFQNFLPRLLQVIEKETP